ncbi:MAG: hypothetical protein WBG77_09540 [Acinetobacter venetianus]|uniref:hypothetical protein n=1 Tax=Acinetobacter venetianus TaxID=52133 RepID=UPI003C744F45
MGKQRALYFEVVDQYLAELGFLFSYLPEPKNIIFHNNPKELVIVDTWLGKINFPQDRSIDIDLLIQIVDWNFLTLPKVFIKGPLSPELEVLIGLAHFLPMPYYIPNNDQSDYYLNICYSLHSEISLPRSHPEELMKWVINQCHKLFDESLNDFSVRDADIKRDLGVMWDQISRILWGSELNFAMDRVHEISSISDRLANTPNDIDAINLRDHYEIELYQRYRSLHLGWLMYIHEIELPKNGMKLHKDYVKWKCTDENKNKEALTFFFDS